MKKVHINERADMSVFDGTEFEGLTYTQVRKRLNPEQLARLERINKRQRKLLATKRAEKKHVRTYR